MLKAVICETITHQQIHKAMSTGFFQVPTPINEPILSYASGSKEREQLQNKLAELRAKQIDIPMYIGGKSIQGAQKVAMTCPHDHQHVLGHYY
jgi:1-pyrroline-5-carboxylate dehydrogenase